MLMALEKGMVVTPNRLITNGMVKQWKYASECANLGGGMMPGTELEVVEVNKTVGAPWVRVQLRGRFPASYLKVSGQEYAWNFQLKAQLPTNVRYDVPLVPQTTAMSCWAAGIAMILAWKRKLSLDPLLIATNPGGVSYLSQFNSSLDPNDQYILRRWGFVTEAPQSYGVEGFTHLLLTHGPLWIVAAVPGPHIRVVTGIDPAAHPSRTIVYINDPWEKGMNTFRWPNRGSQYVSTYSLMVTQSENLGRQELNQPFPIYVAHLP